MGILGQNVNVAASLYATKFFKKAVKSTPKRMESRPKIMYELKEPATIGDLKCDVIIDREVTFASEVTENPVEDGFNVADHVNRKPIPLKMTVLFTPTPVTWFNQLGNNQNRLAEVLNALQNIYRKGEPITIKTVDAIYKDMIMTEAPLPRNVEDGYCYSAQLSFVQVRRVSQKTESLPNASSTGKNGTTETEAGQTSQEDIGTGIITIANKATVKINTAAISKAQSGDILTGKEQKSNAVANALLNSLKLNAASTLINKVGGKVVNKSSPFGKLSKTGGSWI